MSNADVIAQLSDDRFQAAFSVAFGDCVGTYGGDGKVTMRELSHQTGIPMRRLESYRDGETVPRAHGLMVIMEVLPARFANRLLAEIGMGGAKKMSPEDIDLHLVASDAANFTSMFVNHMADGRIDHVEKAQEIAVLRKVSENLNNLLHAHDAAEREATKAGKGKKSNVTQMAKRAGAQ